MVKYAYLLIYNDYMRKKLTLNIYISTIAYYISKAYVLI